MATWVYFLRPVGMAGPTKIGCSEVPFERLMTCSNWSPFPLELVARLVGGVDLERRFHGLLHHSHSHGEWFLDTPEVWGTVVSVAAGTFNLSTLPEPYRLGGRNKRSPEAIAAGNAGRKLTRLTKKGVRVPPDVYAASFTYRCDPAEKARRWAIVREFVEQHP